MTYDSRPATREHIQHVRDNLDKMIDNLYIRGTVHDASKLESPEVEFFDEFTPKLAGAAYGSEEYKGFLAAMKPGLDHHYAKNSHHPEFKRWRCLCDRRFTQEEWDTAPQGPNDSGQRYCPECCRHGMIYECYLKDETDKGLHGMSLLDLIEMVADWQAAVSRSPGGDILKSIAINQKRFGYSDEVRRILENTVRELGFGGKSGAGDESFDA